MVISVAKNVVHGQQPESVNPRAKVTRVCIRICAADRCVGGVCIRCNEYLIRFVCGKDYQRQQLQKTPT